jgi:L-serine dehydratase
LVIVADDVRGSIARITTALAEHDINIATLRLTRKQRGGDAFIVIECDEAPTEQVVQEISALPWVHWSRRLEKVAA